MPITFPDRWIHGARDCRASADPPVQAHEAAPGTFILRQSKCSNFEAPFMYLLIGDRRALLVDTGARTVTGEALPIGTFVDKALTRAEADGVPRELIVAHSHGHGDHLAGDSQFTDRPRTVIVQPDRGPVQRQFGIRDWPEDIGSLDLGNRRLLVIPIPGHESSNNHGHEATDIAIYDEQTGLVLTGDVFYPGLLTVRDWMSYRRSARRLAEFAQTHPITFLLGAHVEMSRTPGVLFDLGTTFQPDEHPLQLTPADLATWAAACEELGEHPMGTPRTVVFDSFAIAMLES
jgi:hydroxyacylglutathione hydrolase